ncbi:MAG: acetyl-CoA acetyltransferase, partial [Cellvibrionaceae bacterium]|nr:acetyl-CoA acetyltransferase [Cellvibrionaceae bacterium]
VLGVEMMRNVSGTAAANNLRGAAWVDKEWCDTDFVWPMAFSDMLAQYQQRYDLDKAHVAAIAQKNYHNARLNPNAQSRKWQFAEGAFSESDELNPPVAGHIRRQDCGQVSDGAAVVFLANADKARDYAKRRGIGFESIPQIKGWGHINAPMLFQEKLNHADKRGYLFPHVARLFQQVLSRAGLGSIHDVDGLEVHDCFNITEYMILDHAGLYPPGEAWRGIEAGVSQLGGALPFNPSGGLIGGGHPVGATGVRMLLDAYKQCSASAGDYQIEGARNMMTFNLGGSATTCASFLVGR